jgi:thioredoxin
MKEINAAEFQAEVLESKVPVLVDLFTPQCGPCRAMMPVLEKLSASLGDTAKVVKVNCNENSELAASLNVRGVPTFKVYRNGVATWTAVGLQSEEKLNEALTAPK